MPAKLDFAKLMDDKVTQGILSKYLERKRDILRWRDFKDIGNHMTLQRRLDGLCGFGVLEKVDRNRRPIKGGKSAPETFYLLRGDQWKRAIWTSDMKSLSEACVDKLSFRQNMSLYGMDESDFEGLEQEKEQYEQLIGSIDFFLGALRGWKMLVLQKKLQRHSKSLEKDIEDPIVRWMAERYLWGEIVIPLYMPWEDAGNRFLKDSAQSLLRILDQDEELNEDERRRVERSIEEGLRLPLTHHDIFQDAIKEAKRFQGGVAVSHMDLRPYADPEDFGKAEAAFEVFLESGKEASSFPPSFGLLEKYVRDTHRYSVKRSRLSLAMDTVMKNGGGQFFKEYLRMQEELDEKLLDMAFRTGYLNPPRPPTLKDSRSFWASEGK